jgi:hypothetical protein
MTEKAGGEDFFLLNNEFNFQAIKLLIRINFDLEDIRYTRKD